MTTFTIARSAEVRRLSASMPLFSASKLPKVARVNWVAVTGVALSPDGVLVSAAPTTRARRARTLTPTVTSKVVRFIIYPLVRRQSLVSKVGVLGRRQKIHTDYNPFLPYFG